MALSWKADISRCSLNRATCSSSDPPVRAGGRRGHRPVGAQIGFQSTPPARSTAVQHALSEAQHHIAAVMDRLNAEGRTTLASFLYAALKLISDVRFAMCALHGTIPSIPCGGVSWGLFGYHTDR
jgi:hypothetical protein